VIKDSIINNGNVTNIYKPDYFGTPNLKAKTINYPSNNKNKFNYIDY